jgi:hypothetical protein
MRTGYEGVGKPEPLRGNCPVSGPDASIASTAWSTESTAMTLRSSLSISLRTRPAGPVASYFGDQHSLAAARLTGSDDPYLASQPAELCKANIAS